MFYEAIYQPKDIKNIDKNAKKFIGKKIAIQDGGQREISPGKTQVVYIALPNLGVIPNSDLSKITSIPLNKWNELSEVNGKKL